MKTNTKSVALTISRTMADGNTVTLEYKDIKYVHGATEEFLFAMREALQKDGFTVRMEMVEENRVVL